MVSALETIKTTQLDVSAKRIGRVTCAIPTSQTTASARQIPVQTAVSVLMPTLKVSPAPTKKVIN